MENFTSRNISLLPVVNGSCVNFTFHGVLHTSNDVPRNANSCKLAGDEYLQTNDYSFLSMIGDALSPRNLLPAALPDDVVVVLVVFYCFIILLAVVGNVIVIVIIARYRPKKSVTDYYIFSLAVSDILVATLNMPFQLYFVCANEWLADGITGEVLCKFTSYVQGVTIIACVLTLTAIAIDRYIVICQPKFARMVHSKRSAMIGILIVWFIALCVLSPHLVYQKLDARLKITSVSVSVSWICAEFYPGGKHVGQIYSMFVYVFLYCVPVVTMIFTYGTISYRLWFKRPVFPVTDNTGQYSRSVVHKKKITKLLIVLVLGFTVLWLPFFTFYIVQVFSDCLFEHMRVKMAILQLIGYSNCCVNPVIYTLFNNSFQKEFLRRCNVLACFTIERSPKQHVRTKHDSEV
ncbi:G-protein coupled receptor [Mactra antiquata]